MANGHLRDSVVDQFFSTGDVSDSFDRESDGANRHPGGLWGLDENIPRGFADSYGSWYLCLRFFPSKSTKCGWISKQSHGSYVILIIWVILIVSPYIVLHVLIGLGIPYVHCVITILGNFPIQDSKRCLLVHIMTITVVYDENHRHPSPMFPASGSWHLPCLPAPFKYTSWRMVSCRSEKNLWHLSNLWSLFFSFSWIGWLMIDAMIFGLMLKMICWFFGGRLLFAIDFQELWSWKRTCSCRLRL